MKYPYGVASYPTGFIGYVVSPTKICLQYSGVDLKFRPLGKDPSIAPQGAQGHYIPVAVSPNTIDVLATGSQMPVLEEMHLGLLDGYKEYMEKHLETYKSTYNKDFKEHLNKLKEKLDILLAMG